jgi:hypothetical protein
MAGEVSGVGRMSLDCQNCHESLAEPAIFDDSFVAVECPVCGVRGPVRALLTPDRFDQVAKLAMDDWNILFNLVPAIAEVPAIPESTETNGTGKAVTPSAEKPVLDKPASSPQAVTTPPAGEGGEGDSEPNTSEGASVEQSSKKAAGEPCAKDRKPDNGGEAVTLQQVSKRLKAWMKANSTNPDYAIKRDGFDFGVSAATLYHLMKGNGSLATVEKVSAALDRLDGKGLARVTAD